MRLQKFDIGVKDVYMIVFMMQKRIILKNALWEKAPKRFVLQVLKTRLRFGRFFEKCKGLPLNQYKSTRAV